MKIEEKCITFETCKHFNLAVNIFKLKEESFPTKSTVVSWDWCFKGGCNLCFNFGHGYWTKTIECSMPNKKKWLLFQP